MAYSGYGGYAFRNGESRLDRSDAVITDRAETLPGLWPGFAFAAQGMPFEEIRGAIWDNPHGHVVLGDGPLHVGLYKQSDVWVWIDGRKIDLVKHGVDLPREAFMTEKWDGTPCDPVFAPTYKWTDLRRLDPLRFEFPDGSKLDVVWIEQDNYYVYARLTQPDGVVWTGWSGYGVGAGHETSDWGYSTEERNRTLMRIWPDAIREPTYVRAP